MQDGLAGQPGGLKRLAVQVGILGNPARVHPVILDPADTHRALERQGRHHHEGDFLLFQVHRQSQRVEAGVLKADQHPAQFICFKRFGQPPDHRVIAGAVVGQLPVQAQGVNENIKRCLGDVDADKVLVVFHSESIKVKHGCPTAKTLKRPVCLKFYLATGNSTAGAGTNTAARPQAWQDVKVTPRRCFPLLHLTF